MFSRCLLPLALLLIPFTARTAEAPPYQFMQPGSAIDRRAHALVQEMTLDEKIGQMMQVDSRAFFDHADITKYAIGSVLSGGSSDPMTGNTAKDWADHYDYFQRPALLTRLKISMLYGTDAVHGHNNVVGATLFP